MKQPTYNFLLSIMCLFTALPFFCIFYFGPTSDLSSKITSGFIVLACLYLIVRDIRTIWKGRKRNAA